MSGRRATAILSILAGAALLAGAAALFLGGDPPHVPEPRPGPVPSPARPAPEDRGSATARPPSPAPERRPQAPLPLEEDDAPPASERKAVPAGWKPWARLRFLDAKSREPIPFGRGHIALLVSPGPRSPEDSRPPLLLPEPWRRAEDGTIEVFRSEDDRGLPAGTDRREWESSAVEVRIPGWERRRFASRADLSGEREVELAASLPSVRGTLRLAPGLGNAKLFMGLDPGDPSRDPRRPDAMPTGGTTKAGPFSWYDVPDGRWRLVVRAAVNDDDTAVAVREFDKTGSAVDLGEILLLPPTTLRARVVARDGTGVLDKELSIRRAGTAEALTSEDIDDGGWVVFHGLEADAEYRIVSTLDGLEETVRTPAEGGGDLRAELRWEHSGVRCRLRFTVDGQDPIQWGDLVEGPTLDKGAWKKDGFLEHDMAPGDYFFGFLARPVGRSDPVRVYARFTVPDQPLWDATIDLKEPK